MQGQVEIDTFKMERPEESGPLSWRLTPGQIRELKKYFEGDEPWVYGEWRRMKGFLGFHDPAACQASPEALR